METPTEKVTLHFDFSHLPGDTELTLVDHSRPVLMKTHTPATRLLHKQSNKLLGLLSDEHLDRLTHYAEVAEFSSTEVSTCIITYPSRRPGAAAGAIAGIYTHKPRAEVRRTAETTLLQSAGNARLPGRIRQYGIDAAEAHGGSGLLQGHRGDLLADAGYTINYKDTALKLVMQHPDIATMVPDSYVRIEDVIWEDPHFNKFARYIKEHSDDEDDNCWYENTITRDMDGNVMQPCETLTDKDGLPVVFPKMMVDGREVSVIPQYKLSDGVCKAMTPLLNSVLETLMDMPALKGENWSTQNGSTAHVRTGDDTPLLRSNLMASNAGPWTVTAPASGYGLDFQMDSLNFDPNTKRLGFDVKHWANRWVGVYVEFLDADGEAIEKPDNWVSQSSGLGNYDTDKTNRYLETLGPGCTVFGIVIADLTLDTHLEFPVPDNAASVKIRFCGMGHGDVPGNLYEIGMTYTLLISYGLPTLLMLLSVGMQSNRRYIAFMEKQENLIMVSTVASVLMAPLFMEGSRRIGAAGMGAKLGEFLGGVLLNYGLKKLAMLITEEVSYQQFLQNQPAVGWMLKVMSCASAVAGIASTVRAIGLSPADMTYEARRSMQLDVTVSPDPSHGTTTQAPIWPETGTKYKMLVQYEGSKRTLIKEAPLPAKNDLPISVSFCNATGDALAVIPKKKFQVVCTIYTRNDSIVGQWTSEWQQLSPGASGKLALAGAIMERLVPLTGGIRYEHKKKLTYNASTKKYEWDGRAGGAPQATAASLAQQEVSELGGLTINNLAYKLGYTYRATRQNLPLDNDTRAVDTPMYLMKNISVLNDPGMGMKFSGFGMSVRPALAYDQFGPMGLFALDPATDYHAALNDCVLTPALREQFKINGITLKEHPIVRTLVRDTYWSISFVGSSAPSYALKRQVDVIKVFPWPVPEFSARNYFLDTRTYARDKKFHLRLVDLYDKSSKAEFGADSAKSWGTFGFALDDMAIHPAGYAVGINYEHHRMAVLKLNDDGVSDDKAESAMVLCGPGVREGLLLGPAAMTISADGRILVLEAQNARIQAFDVTGNPVPCFAAALKFTIADAFADQLKAKKFKASFWQALQANIPVSWNTGQGTAQRYLNAPKVNLDTAFAADLDKLVISPDLRKQFAQRSLPLAEDAKVHVTRMGELWLIESDGAFLDLRKGKEFRQEINVYTGMAVTLTEQANGSHWLFNDNANGLAFDVRKDKEGKFEFRHMVAYMPLKKAEKVQYLDIASEMKGYIYVLSRKDPGNSPSDYVLDIYQPDGSPLTASGNNGQPVAARLAVDQWRNMFTLNYEQFEGAAGRREPGVSVWIPNA